MKEEINALIADLRDALDSIRQLKEEYDHFWDHLEEDELDVYQKAVIGYFLHNFYNACESIFMTIYRFFENDLDPRQWHKSLLRRMKLDIEEVRPAVISEELYEVLNDFRAFRHVFRNLYSFELDWQREKVVADRFDTAVDGLQKEIEDFISFLQDLKED